SNREYLANIVNQEHGSVLEHVVWNFIITGVSRSFTHELVRHRVGVGFCLSGDTEVYSEHFGDVRTGDRDKDGTRKRRNGVKRHRLRDLHQSAHTPHGRSRLRLMKVRCLNEADGFFTTSSVATVVQSGVKPVFEVRLVDGKSIKATKEHRFLTPQGWQSLDSLAGGIEVRGSTTTWGNHDAATMVNGVPAYQDIGWLREHYHERGLDLLVPRARRVQSICYVGEEMTYDLEMAGSHKNFVANGIITHNSQLSQRYVDESDTDVVVPPMLLEAQEANPERGARIMDLWKDLTGQTVAAYKEIADLLADHLKETYPDMKPRDRRIKGREAARSVLPNAVESKIFFSANARALRHIIEYRGDSFAEAEIRRLAVMLLRIMQMEAPVLFGDYTIVRLPDGSEAVLTDHKKV
ncbi:MAG: FAD-dependent thymidylate synthase, partial [Chloroflexi bacterium]|nr:FAD-dependent thymidylate synthase [Chloroflexota bacterium]